MGYLSETELEWYQHRADEARAMAESALTPEMRKSFLGIAEQWEAMIRRARRDGEPSAAKAAESD